MIVKLSFFTAVHTAPLLSGLHHVYVLLLSTFTVPQKNNNQKTQNSNFSFKTLWLVEDLNVHLQCFTWRSDRIWIPLQDPDSEWQTLLRNLTRHDSSPLLSSAVTDWLFSAGVSVWDRMRMKQSVQFTLSQPSPDKNRFRKCWDWPVWSPETDPLVDGCRTTTGEVQLSFGLISWCSLMVIFMSNDYFHHWFICWYFCLSIHHFVF